MLTQQTTDILIIGGGASGLVCAMTAANRGKKVVVLDHRQRLGDRIAISGGGMCNFTNRFIGPEHFVCDNPRFLFSPLKAFTSDDAVQLLKSLDLTYEEREYGQLFCRQGGNAFRNALLRSCSRAGVHVSTSTTISGVEKNSTWFLVHSPHTTHQCSKLVVACGGMSYAGLGATDLGFRLARQFGHTVSKPLPGLVPLILEAKDQRRWSAMAGISLYVRGTIHSRHFEGDLLFTHKGLSGPLILTMSNHWHRGDPLFIDWLPSKEADDLIEKGRSQKPRSSLRSQLTPFLPKRLVNLLLEESLLNKNGSQISRSEWQHIIKTLKNTEFTPQTTDGFEKAEVTRGGVNTREIESKTMQSRLVPGLHFTGEVLDVTGNLGGYNLHWAWASGVICGLGL